MTAHVRTSIIDALRVVVHADADAAAAASATEAADALRSAIHDRGQARVLFASAPSQESTLRRLVIEPELDWSRVQAFHIDEYIGLPADAPQSFGRWIAERLSPIGPGRLERIQPAADPSAEARRYAELLATAPIDLACLGVGVNGHLAFNEPGQCHLDDPETVRVVRLHHQSRRQQVDDRCFDRLDDVPHEALTLTLPALLGADRIVAVVPGAHKAAAVAAALQSPIGPGCPASALRTHPAATLHLDDGAASLLTPPR